MVFLKNLFSRKSNNDQLQELSTIESIENLVTDSRKYLDHSGLSHLVDKLKSIIRPTETQEYMRLEPGVTHSIEISDYDENESTVDVYLDGLQLLAGVEYTLSSDGIIELKVVSFKEGSILQVNHRKWG